MNISALRVRLVIQKNQTVTDAVGNHYSEWSDYFHCWGTPVTDHVDETENAAHVVSTDRLSVTIRWSSETAVITPTEYRVIINGSIYNITGIDDMGFKHKSRKLHVEGKER